MSDEYPQDCVLCGASVPSVLVSHNPAPLATEGRCCSLCNYSRVIPERVAQMLEGDKCESES